MITHVESGRNFTFPANLVDSVEEISHGLLFVDRLIPSGLKSRYLKNRKMKIWYKDVMLALSKLYLDRNELKSTRSNEYEDLTDLIKILTHFQTSEEDPGMICDCFAWTDSKNGDKIRVLIDTLDSHDLSKCAVMGPYRETGDIGTFSALDMLTFTINIDSIDLLSVVCDSGAHGSHVATICAGLFSDDDHSLVDLSSERHGVAPMAKLLSIKIGDPRLESMESGESLARAISVCIERNVDIINLSYGETVVISNSQGLLSRLISKAVNEHGIIFVSSAGNGGPALSTLGAPGGTFDHVIGIGAFLTPEMGRRMYTTHRKVSSSLFPFSSRGPTEDGSMGVAFCAPGAAISGIPNWRLSGIQLMNGTSMSSPNAAGCIALLVSALKAKGIPFTPISIARAIKQTALMTDDMDVFACGQGLVQVVDAFEQHRNSSSSDMFDVGLTITVESTFACDANVNHGCHRGIYVRCNDPYPPIQRYVLNLKPFFVLKSGMNQTHEAHKRMIDHSVELSINSSVDWIKCPKHVILMNDNRRFDIEIDVSCNELPSKEIVKFKHGKLEFRISEKPQYGIIETFPVTILNPVPVRNLRFTLFEQNNIKIGQIIRNFIAVPSYVRNVVARLENADCSEDSDVDNVNAAQFMFHAQYLHRLQRSSNGQIKRIFTLKSGHTHPHDIQISIPPTGTVLEICVAKSWNWNLDKPSALKCTIICSTIRTIPSTIELSSNDLCQPFMLITGDYLSSPGSKLEIREPRNTGTLNIEWTNVVVPLMPVSANLSPAKVLHSAFEELRYLYELHLDYDIHIPKDKTTLRIETPTICNYLYDSEFLSQPYTIYDSNRRPIVSGDALTETKAKLLEGDYKIKLRLVHHRAAILDELKKFSINALLHLPAEILNLNDFYPCVMSCLAQTNKISSISFGGCNALPLFLRKAPEDKLPEILAPGTSIMGVLRVHMSHSIISGPLRICDIRCKITCRESAENSDKTEENETADDEILRAKCLLIANENYEYLKQFEEAKDELDSRLQFALLTRYVADHKKNESKELLDKIINLSSLIIANIETDEFRQKLISVKTDDSKLVKQTNELKSRLIKTLLIKGQALIHPNDEGFDGSVDTDVLEDLNSVFDKLLRYASNPETSSSTRKFVGQVYWIRRRMGKALSIFTKISEQDLEVSRWIRKIFEQLGWIGLAEMYQNSIIRRFIVDDAE